MDFDVIIIGGGINGCGIARDCSLRGLKVLLLEKGDFSGGTSGSSSQMIHGGLRYLLYDPETTKLSCQDSGYIQKIAPHLIFRIPFIYPVYKTEDGGEFKAKLFLESLEALMERYDRYIGLKGGKPHCRLSAQEALKLEPGLNPEGLLGAVTFDEWGIDVGRLCFLNAHDAAEHGAILANHAEVTEFLKSGSRVTGVKYRIGSQIVEAKAKIIINAAGPWAPTIAAMAGASLKLRPGKGVHLFFDRRLSDVAINAKTIDGREVFLMPFENTSFIGTTDDDYFGDLDDQRVLRDEVDYLLEAIARVFPMIRQARLTHTISGVRPTLYARNTSEDQLSREHEIVDHGPKDAVEGLISMTGGKLASYRIMSEEITDLVCQRLGVDQKCSTHIKPLPGGDEVPDVASLAKEFDLEPYLVSRLILRHGSKARQICEDMSQNPIGKTLICACEPVTQAELDYVVRHEMASELADLKRRTRLMLGPCQGLNCQLAAMDLLLEHQKTQNPLGDWQAARQKDWPNRGVALTEAQMPQEELVRAAMYTVLCLDKK